MKKIFNNRISKAVRAMIVLSAFIHSTNFSLAQTVAGYTFSSSAGTYSAISGGTLLVSGTSAMDSWVSSAITIPSFSLACTAYTTAYVTSNGQLSLGGSAPSTTTYTGVSSGVGSGICICPFSADLDDATNTAASEIRWQTIGSEVIFQWTKMCRYGVTESFDFQIRLNTSTNVITFVYQLNSGPGTSTSYQPQVGIRTSATDYKNLQISTGAETWAAPLAGTANSNTCRFTSTAVAKSFTTGQTYTWTPSASCSGTPAPGNTLASSNPACSGVPFTLSMSGSAAGCGITCQWQSSPDNTTWTNIAGATSSTYSATQSAATYYRCLVTCTNSSSSAYSTVVSVTMNSPSTCYCVNTNTVNTSYYISNFTATGTTTINNTTGFSTNGYGNYTAISVTQMQAQTVTFSITETGGSMHFGIWVDWNDDGDFSDAGEEVYYNATYSTSVSGSFTVPATAATGSHRMRVVGNELGTVAACTGSSTTECEDYTIIVTALPICSGTPNAGTANISSASGCMSTNFDLSATGLTIASGITYQWQSAPAAGGSWTNISGANSATLTTSATANTWYQLVTTCANSSLSNNTNVVSYTIVGDVCTCGAYPSNYASNTADEDVSNVTVGTLNNSSALGAVAGGAGSIAFRYSNYTGIVGAPNLQQLATVSFSLSSLTTGSTYNNGFQVYIDYNQDGDFADAGEQIYSSAASTSGPHTETGSFVVPLSATLGITRMRVICIETTFPTATNYASSAYSYGETEDYCVNITTATACSGTPNAGTATISSGSGCASTNFTLSATGITAAGGITYQWQSGTSSTGPWTNIAGATSSTLTTSATANTWYQLVTTCANSTLSNNTNVVSYSVVGDICTCGVYPSNYASNTADEDVSNVTVGTMNNSSALGAVAGGTGSIAFRYSNYAGIVGAPSLQQLATVNFSLSSLTTGSNYNNGFQIYIDYNQDGDFADAGEQVYNSAASTSGPHTETGSFVVPLSATVGITRMRVICVETTFPSTTNYTSSAYSYGETEDYCVNITAAPPCSGTPAGGTTTATSSSCGQVGAISVTGSTEASGLTYQWYSAPTAGGSWTPIAGATGATYTPAVSGLFYQRVITCTASGNSATSSSLQYITSSPSNDDCVNAIPLTVNAGTACTSVTAGTVLCASASSEANSCYGTADDDVWFSFVATNTSHTISLLNIAGSVTDMYHSVYSGTCGALTNIKCNDADVSTITGLTIGATYYVRVYTYTATAGQTTTFNICVSTSNVVSVVGSSTCENAMAFCATNDNPGVDFAITADAIASPTGQCTFMKNPSWWYMQVSQNGDLDMTIASSCGDVDFACYGPFSNVTCLPTDLTNTSPSQLISNPEYHYTYNPTSLTPTSSTEIPLCQVSTLYSPSGNLVDFAGSISATEYLQIRNAVVGQYYIVLIGNYKQCAGTVSFNQTNFGAAGAGAVDCDIVTQCNITSITATTTVTGSTYSVSGNINFIDPPVTGTLTICDGTVCQTFTAPFTSPQAYTLTGLIPDGLQHQLTATFSSATVNCEKISNYASPPNSLPVNLLKLNANCQNSTAAVYWQTASETNNDYFVVEKRNSKNVFYEIGRIDGAGNSNSLIDYMFIDKSLLPGDNYYRLSQVDFDGTTTIYPTITLNCDSYTEVQPTMQAYPNPFVDEVNVVIQNLDEGEFTLEIINELGKVVYQKKCIATNSEFRTLLNLYNLQPAVYNLQCRSQKNVLTIRVVKK